MSATHQAELDRCPSAASSSRLPRPLYSSRSRPRSGIFVEVFCARDMSFVAAYPEHVLTLQFSSYFNLLQRIAAHESTEKAGPGNTVDITPADVLRHWHYDGDAEIVMLHIAPSQIESIAAGENRQSPERVELVMQRGIRDARIERHVLRLLAELMVAGFADLTCVQLVADLLTIHILREYSTISAVADRVPSKLARHKLQHATDYIRKNLPDDLSLVTISKAVCMSPCHFAHQFKQATGHTPHRYVMGCRMEKAKSLLRETDLPVNEVAQMVGYSSQSHFSTVFRQSIGQSPLRYRKDA